MAKATNTGGSSASDDLVKQVQEQKEKAAGNADAGNDTPSDEQPTNKKAPDDLEQLRAELEAIKAERDNFKIEARTWETTADNLKLQIQQKEEADLEKEQQAERAFLSEQEKLEKIYGKNYVVARKGVLQTVFTQKAWLSLPDDKEGWKAIAKKPKDLM